MAKSKTRHAQLATLISRHSGLSKEWFSPKEIETFKSASLVVLGVLAAAGVAMVSIAAPNALQVLNKILFSKRSRRLGRSFTKREKEIKAAQIFYYLKRTGMINLKPAGNDLEASLSPKGKNLLAKAKLSLLKVNRKPKWDGKWWQIAADIPTEAYRTAADMFRKKIKQMGFYALQRTLWFYPFDPRREIQLVAEYFGIQKYITAMEISRMDVEDERTLKQHFKKIKVL